MASYAHVPCQTLPMRHHIYFLHVVSIRDWAYIHTQTHAHFTDKKSQAQRAIFAQHYMVSKLPGLVFLSLLDEFNSPSPTRLQIAQAEVTKTSRTHPHLEATWLSEASFLRGISWAQGDSFKN